MANGNIVSADAKWSGTIEINGIRAKGDFEVFNSGGGWAFLFGKPLLQSFKAEHDYKSDSITIANDFQSTIIRNQVAHPRALQQVERGISLTQDIKQARNDTEKPTSPTILAHAPMGQWKPNAITSKQREQ
jgi:hypothetical protein